MRTVVTPNKKATYEISRKWLFMEAAGIEPASRDISAQTSTCVVETFPRFRAPDPDRLGSWRARREQVFSPGRARRDPGRSEIGNRLLGLSGEDPQSGLPVV